MRMVLKDIISRNNILWKDIPLGFQLALEIKNKILISETSPS